MNCIILKSLYDLERDPHEVNNLADDPAFSRVRGDLIAKLKELQETTSDPWITKWTYE